MEWGAGCGRQRVLTSFLRNCKTLKIIEGKHTAASSVPACFGVVREGGLHVGEPAMVAMAAKKQEQKINVFWSKYNQQRNLGCEGISERAEVGTCSHLGICGNDGSSQGVTIT